MWTKGNLVDKAFEKIGLGNAFNVTPDRRQKALLDLDSMMALWSGQGIRLGYNQPSDAEGADMGDPSGLPDTANQAAYMNLAVLIAPDFGKTPALSVVIFAKQAYDALLARATYPQQQQFPGTLIRGAGNKPWRGGGYPRPFMPTPTDPLTAEEGGDVLTFE